MEEEKRPDVCVTEAPATGDGERGFILSCKDGEIRKIDTSNDFFLQCFTETILKSLKVSLEVGQRYTPGDKEEIEKALAALKSQNRPLTLNEVERAASTGDVDLFMGGKWDEKSGPKENLLFLKETRLLFETTPVGLFGATRSEELAACYREARAIAECGIPFYSMGAISQVKALGEKANEKMFTVYRIAYEYKKMAREFGG